MDDAKRLERLIFFSDAVVAIAITLLILPLMDTVTEHGSDSLSVPDLLTDNTGRFFAFLLSFVVIARMWTAHHALFSDMAGFTSTIRDLSFAWLVTIVFLPFPTVLVAEYHPDRWTILLYMGDIAASACVLAGICLVVARHPSLQAEGSNWSDRRPLGLLVPAVILVAALMLSLLIPALSYFPFFLLVLSGPVERTIRRYTKKTRSV